LKTLTESIVDITEAFQASPELQSSTHD